MDQTVLQSLDADRLLCDFRRTAGLENPEGVRRYGGWESTDLRGHTLGHYLTALSYDYGVTGNDSIKQLTAYIVSELGKCQDAIGTGYLSAFPERMVAFADTTGMGWAPYYTLHKILQGLQDVYRYTDNSQALDIASRFGDYLYGRTLNITDNEKWVKVMDIMEIGGIAEGLLNLYQYTAKPEHLAAGKFFQQMDKLEPAERHEDILNDKRTDNFCHVNATIPQFIAALRQYEITGEPFYLEAASYFWEQVTGHRCYSNASTGKGEHWNMGPDSLTFELDFNAGETCSTYNLIRLANELFRFSPQSKYADYVESALFNHILGSICPETGDIMYFHTQLQGSFKSYGTVNKVFWCCSGTGLENHVRYAENIYFKGDNQLYVNLFVPSTLHWGEKGIEIEQTTAFPNEGHTQLVVCHGKAAFEWLIRIPSWCKAGFEVNVNGVKQEVVALENGYCSLTGEWKEGDVIDIQTPLQLWLKPTPDNAQIASLMYGPLVLAGDMGTEGVTYELVHPEDYYYEHQPEAYKAPFDIPQLTGDMTDLSWLKPVSGAPLHFETSTTSDGQTIQFFPLYQFYKNRFVTYWNFKTNE